MLAHALVTVYRGPQESYSASHDEPKLAFSDSRQLHPRAVGLNLPILIRGRNAML